MSELIISTIIVILGIIAMWICIFQYIKYDEDNKKFAFITIIIMTIIFICWLIQSWLYELKTT